MMIKNLLPLLAVSLLVGGCGVTDMFKSKAKKPLEGERISIMALQKSLQPDEGLAETSPVILPQVWNNKFWPQTGGYPNHSMQHLELGPAPMEVKWQKRIGLGSTNQLPLTAQPIVVDGVIYVLDAVSILSARDIENGDRLWWTSIRDADEDDPVIGGGLAYANGVLYATNGFDEALAISPKDGEILWRKNLPAAVRAAPTIMDGRMFISTLDNRLVALNADDGSTLWEHAGLSEATGIIGAASPAVNRDIVVPAFSSGEVSALRVENGSVAWSDNLSSLRRAGGLAGLSDVRALPVIDKGLVIAISFNGRLVAIDERTGQRVWQREISGAQTPWVAGSHIFVLSENNELVALERDNGAIYWITELPRYADARNQDDPVRWAGPILAGGRLMLASSHKIFAEIDPVTGEISRQFEIDSPTSIPPIVAGGRLYILGEDGILTAYE